MEITLPSLTFAAANQFAIYKNFSGLAALDIFTTYDGKRNTFIKTNFISIEPRAGLELGYDSKVFLRAGVGNIQEIPLTDGDREYRVQINLGAGIQFRGLSIDYALSNLGSDENFYPHVFSLRYRFSTKQSTEKMDTNSRLETE